MRSKFLAAATAVAMTTGVGSAFAADLYKIDQGHTYVGFEVSHFGYSDMVGFFGESDGEFMFDGSSVEGASVTLTVNTASVNTRHQARDDHLRSPDFFNAQEFPEMTFKSTAIESTGERTAKVTGDLTLLGVTQPVTLDVTFNNAMPFPMDPSVYIAGFSARGTLDRTQFGMKYAEGAIGSEVELVIEVEGIKQ